jgi:hypothetical protein
MNNFSHCLAIECPDCSPMGKRPRKPLLDCVERNYSGCGADIGRCPECGHGFEISFKVDAITREDNWDGLPRSERETREKRAQEQDLRERRQQLQAELSEIETLLRR